MYFDRKNTQYVKKIYRSLLRQNFTDAENNSCLIFYTASLEHLQLPVYSWNVFPFLYFFSQNLNFLFPWSTQVNLFCVSYVDTYVGLLQKICYKQNIFCVGTNKFLLSISYHATKPCQRYPNSSDHQIQRIESKCGLGGHP